jgi:MFS family permease
MTASTGTAAPAPAPTRAPASSVSDYVVKGGWYTLWALLAVTLFGFVDRQVLTLVAAPMMTDLNLSDSQLGVVQGLAFAIFSLVAVYPIAWAADRFDRRIVLGLCVITWTLGTAACGLARNFEQLFLATVAIAAGEAGVVPIANACIPELFKGRKRLLANGLIYIFAFLGIAAGLALGGSAIGALDAIHGDLPESLRAFETWRLAFFLVALPAPLFLILVAFTKLGGARRGATAAPAMPTIPAHSNFWPYLKLHRRAVASVFGALCLYMLAFGGYLTWLPVVTSRLYGTSPAENGAAMGIATAIGMVGGVAAGTLIVRRQITRLGPLAAIRFCWLAMLVSAPVLIAFPFIAAPWQGFALFGLLMLSGSAIGCMVPTMLQDMAPADLRARLFALWGMTSGLVAGFAPSLVGWTSTALGSEPRMLLTAMAIVAVPSWIGAILLFRVAEGPFVALLADSANTDSEPSR